MTAPTLTPGTRLGPYEITSPLGMGGMGEVYRATDTNLKRQVAIKVLPQKVAADPSRLARFQREAEVLATLNHPNIAAIYGLERADGTTALVMELVEGPTLADRIAQGAIPVDEALSIARQIAEALEAAHEQGIIHRDLKPANIKVRPDGAVKVLDFGLAKAMEPTGAMSAPVSMAPTITTPAMTQAGMILGTAAYMSPEQARGKTVDKRADIWAFGCVLYEMLTARRPFEDEDVSLTLSKVLQREPDFEAFPAEVPARVQQTIRLCLRKPLRERLPDIGTVRLALEGAFETAGLQAAGSGDASSPMALRRVVPSVIAAVLGTAVAATLATWALTRPTPELRPLIRLNVDFGPDAVGGERTTIAISPDGRRIVFPIRGASATPQLATRLLDQGVPTPLPGTENGVDPFFSPDGQWIAFWADRKLKKISVLGGAAVTVCDAPALRGGSWGEDGTIVAALDSWHLFRIPAAGGTPQQLTTLVNGEQTHRWPQILPGGQSVLFTASIDVFRYEDATLQVLSVKTGQATTVVRGGSFGRYLSGHLTYVHRGALFGVPFDLARLAVRGGPIALLDDVATTPVSGSGQFDVSRTGTVVYRTGKAAQGYPVVWLDSAGKTEPLLPRPGNYVTPRVSPDGRQLALGIDGGEGYDIYAYDMQRDAMSRLTFNGHGNRNPVWTPDGRHLIYASVADKAIMWIRADGAGGAQRLLESKNLMVPWSVSPDGRYLSYTEDTVDTQTDLWILPVDASDPEHPRPGTPEVFLKTPASEDGAAFSPDGRWITYTSDESGRPEVYVRPFHRSPDGKWLISTSGGIYSIWARDRRLYYPAGSADRRIRVVEYAVNGDSFTASKPRVWSETPLRLVRRSFHALDLAPDGKRFAVLPTDAVEEKGSVHATFLLNFLDELQRRLP